MNRIVKHLSTLTIGAALVCASGIALAEDGNAKPEGEQKRERPERPGNREGAPGARLEQAIGELNLTDDQRAQIKTIADEVREKLQALREELKDASPEERRAKLQEVLGPAREKMLAVLTDEQKQQLRERMEAARGKRDGEGPRAGPRDGEGKRKGPPDGERPRKGPRDGEGEKKGPRDGDEPKEGPRDD